MTRKEIRDAAKAKGYKIEESGNQIGICKGNHIWHWWRTLSLDEDEYALFDHSYNQNTGESKKGLRHGWKVEDSLYNILFKEVKIN